MATSYDTGDVVRFSANFTDPFSTPTANDPIDPAVVKFDYKKPDGSVTSLTYLTDADLIKESTGVYRVDLELDAPGLWTIRFYSTGTGQAAEETEVIVQQSNVATAGPGTDPVTLRFANDGQPVRNARILVSSDADGTTVVAGPAETDDNGEITFYLSDGSTYYLWAYHDQLTSMLGTSFTATAD